VEGSTCFALVERDKNGRKREEKEQERMKAYLGQRKGFVEG
jgi:hypothetical protein